MSFAFVIHRAFSAFADHSPEDTHGKFDFMRAPTALSIVIALLAVFAACGVATAQDAIPQTPPELRDFRLDPERVPEQPQSEPTTQPVIATPPPVVSTIPERATERTQPQPERQSAERPSQSPAAQTRTAEPQPDVVEPIIAPEVPDVVVAESVSTAEPQASAVAYWQIAAGLALLATLLVVGLWVRRRRTAAEISNKYYVDRAVQPAFIPKAVPSPPASAPPIPAREMDAKRPTVALEFVPEKAMVSFATLTVKGQLRLTNTGDAPAKGMELRAGLISAGEQQGNAIRAFHASRSDIQPEALGDAKPGEMIAMSIELSVPLTDMHSFSLGEQKLMVPIMVANLTYSGTAQASADISQIACMIGREATPPVAKMGALRLDLGPRSFAPLGQRLLYA